MMFVVKISSGWTVLRTWAI